MFNNPKQVNITLSNRSIVRTILLVTLAVIMLRFISSVGYELKLLGISAFLAIALNPAVTWLTGKLKSRSRARATGVAYLIVVGALVGFLSLVIPPFVSQTTDFIQQVPTTISDLKTQDTAVARTIRRYNLDNQLDKLSQDFQAKVSDNVGNLSTSVFTAAGRIGGTLFAFVAVLVLTFMMLVEGPLWLKRIWSILPATKRAHHQRLARDMYGIVTGYVNGQVLIAAIAAGFSLVAMLIFSSLFNVSINAVALAGIVFLFGLIPMIGNTIAAAIVALSSLLVSLPLAIAMSVYFLLYQQIENVTLQPMIQARQNQLTPLIVFAAALLGAGLGGLLGAFVAIPAAGCIKILIQDYLSTRLPAKEAISNTSPLNND